MNHRIYHRLCVAPMMDWTDFIEKTAGLVHRGALPKSKKPSPLPGFGH